jgi:hypothetical protein
LERVENAGGATEQSTSGPVIRDPSGNALVLSVAALEP